MKTRINCPQCRNAIAAEIDQLFDLNENPMAKDRLLSEPVNQINCPICGFTGRASAPIVYHDPEKELLLTLVPSGLGLPVTEQEKITGALIQRVLERLEPKQRKAYLFQPKTMLSFQGLIENILEADGITKEMIQAQQEKTQLIERLLTASPESRVDIIHQNEDVIDAEFFAIFSRIVDTLAEAKDAPDGEMRAVYELLLRESKIGKEIYEKSVEMSAAAQSLKELGEKISREKLLELVIHAPNEHRLNALVRLARAGIDYVFFQLLTQQIEQQTGLEKKRLTDLRSTLVDLTEKIDLQINQRIDAARVILEEILAAQDIRAKLIRVLPHVDEFFIQALNSELNKAHQNGDPARVDKINQIVEIIKDVSNLPPEMEMIDTLLQCKTENDLEKMLSESNEVLPPNLIKTVDDLIVQFEGRNQDDIVQKLKMIKKTAGKYFSG